MITLNVNGRTVALDVPEDERLVWVLRDDLELPGTRYGCGAGHCGSCTVLIDGVAVRSCQIPAASVQGRNITTVDATPEPRSALAHVREAFLEHQVPQCGWCMSGWQLTLASQLENNPEQTDETLLASLDGNLCRCGTYARIKRASVDAAERVRADRASGSRP